MSTSVHVHYQSKLSVPNAFRYFGTTGGTFLYRYRIFGTDPIPIPIPNVMYRIISSVHFFVINRTSAVALLPYRQLVLTNLNKTGLETGVFLLTIIYGTFDQCNLTAWFVGSRLPKKKRINLLGYQIIPNKLNRFPSNSQQTYQVPSKFPISLLRPHRPIKFQVS